MLKWVSFCVPLGPQPSCTVAYSCTLYKAAGSETSYNKEIVRSYSSVIRARYSTPPTTQITRRRLRLFIILLIVHYVVNDLNTQF